MSPGNSKLIDRLHDEANRVQTSAEKRRDQRINLPDGLSLDMRRSDGRILCVRALNVSESGVAFHCPDRLPLGETIELRMNNGDTPGKFETFHVVHVDHEGGRLMVGAALTNRPE